MINWDEFFHRKEKNKEIMLLSQALHKEANKDKRQEYILRIELVDKLLNWEDYKTYHELMR